jgi:glycosidase
LDQRLGTVEELRELTSEAHRLGMYVIIDVAADGWRDGDMDGWFDEIYI